MSVNNFGLFFTRDNTVIRLPVNPAKLPVSRDTANGDYNVLGLGPVMQPRTPKQREVTISSYFPGRPFSGVLTSGGFQPPEFYIDFFNSAMTDLVPILYTPVRYYEDGEPFMTGDTGFQALVTQFNFEERGGETGDFYYDLTLTEYRDYSPAAMQVQNNGQPAAAGDASSGTAPAPLSVTTTPARSIPQGQLYAGCSCAANGPWYYSSYGDEPHGNGNGRQVTVSRIVDKSRPCPSHGTGEDGSPLGWMAQASLQAVGGI